MKYLKKPLLWLGSIIITAIVGTIFNHIPILEHTSKLAANIGSSHLSVPIWITIFFPFLLGSIFTFLVIQVYNLKHEVKHAPIDTFMNSFDRRFILDSECATYICIRNMAGHEDLDQSRYYYVQFLKINKTPRGEHTFSLYGYWGNSDFFVSGSCIRIGDNLILYGATRKHYDSFQVAIFSYPSTPGQPKMKGVFSFSRNNSKEAMATRIIAYRIEQNDVVPEGHNLEYLKKLSSNKQLARRFSKTEFEQEESIRAFLGGEHEFSYTLEYLNGSGPTANMLSTEPKKLTQRLDSHQEAS